MNSLQDIIPRLRKPKNLPGALPLIHVRKLKIDSFEQIIRGLSLSPHPDPCKVFKKHLLYFSYGDVFYETGTKPEREICELPICFLFNPKALAEIDYYYPYDTGAAHFDKYGRHSEHLKDNFERYKVNGNNDDFEICRQLIYYIYGTNRNYINSTIKNKTKIQKKLYESFPELFDFLQDTDIEDCDARQYTIECQKEKEIDLKSYLEWIAFPEIHLKLYMKLFRYMQPEPPTYYAYQAGTVFNPLKITGKIQGKAQEYINQKYLPQNR